MAKHGKSSNDYIADVLESTGWKVQLSEREEAEERFEEEFEDILHFRRCRTPKSALLAWTSCSIASRFTAKKPRWSASWKSPGLASAARK